MVHHKWTSGGKTEQGAGYGPLIAVKQLWFWIAVYHLIGRDDVAAYYAPPTDPPYTGKVFQPAASPAAAENTDSFGEEPPLLEGKQFRY